MNDFCIKKSKKLRMITFIIGFVMMFVVGITLLSNGNTIYAEENNETENTQVHQAAAMTVQNDNEDQGSTSIHVLAFGIVIIVSGGTAGILVAIRKRNKMKKHNCFHNF